MKSRSFSRVLFVLKVLVSVAIVMLLIHSSDIPSVVWQLETINYYYLPLVAALWAGNQVLVTIRWLVLLRVLKHTLTLAEGVRSTFAGHFASLFVPGEWGVDLAWLWALRKKLVNSINPLFSIIMDKIVAVIGCIVVAFVGLVAAQLYPSLGIDVRLLTMMALIMLMAAIIGGSLLAISRFTIAPKPRSRVHRLIGAALQTLGIYRQHPGSIFMSAGISILSRVVTVIFVFSISTALGWTVPIVYFFLFVPIILLVSSIPVSWQNVGVREGLYVYFFTQVGVSSEQALALGVALLVWSLTSGAACVLVFYIGSYCPRDARV